MKLYQTNIYKNITIPVHQTFQLIDIFSESKGKKTITLQEKSSLTYLVVGNNADIDIQVLTWWKNCSVNIFWLFFSDKKHPITCALKTDIQHSHASADIHLVSFLFNWAKVSIDGSINILPHLQHIQARLLEHNVVMGKDVVIKTLPGLNISSHHVQAKHGASIDQFDDQKLFYLMSRGLSAKDSQKLLIQGYRDTALSMFTDFLPNEIDSIKHRIHLINASHEK